MQFCNPPQVKPLLWSPLALAVLCPWNISESCSQLPSQNQDSPVPPGPGALEFDLPFCPGKSHGKPLGKAATDTTGHRATHGWAKSSGNRGKRQKLKGIISACACEQPWCGHWHTQLLLHTCKSSGELLHKPRFLYLGSLWNLCQAGLIWLPLLDF